MLTSTEPFIYPVKALYSLPQSL